MIDRAVTFPGYLDSVPQACAALCLAVLLAELEAYAESTLLCTRQVGSLVDIQPAGCVQSTVRAVGNTPEERAVH